MNVVKYLLNLLMIAFVHHNTMRGETLYIYFVMVNIDLFVIIKYEGE